MARSKRPIEQRDLRLVLLELSCGERHRPFEQVAAPQAHSLLAAMLASSLRSPFESTYVPLA